jgi:pimeloyl-ACP methyl ester carboxylesterase
MRKSRLAAGVAVALGLWWRWAPTGRVVSLETGEPVGGGCLAFEQAIVLPVAAAARPLGLDRTGESVGVAAALVAAHPPIRRLPSIWTDSLRERPVVLEIGPEQGPPAAAVVFLHGYGGAFTWPCAQVAEAASRAGATTLCPALSAEGRWARGDGPRRVRAVLDGVAARGIDRVFLVGLSNGAVGAAALAPGLARRIDGLVLISGGSAPDLPLPTLVIHGTEDRMARTPALVRRPGLERATWRSDHFLLLRERAAVTDRLAQWLRERDVGPR